MSLQSVLPGSPDKFEGKNFLPRLFFFGSCMMLVLLAVSMLAPPECSAKRFGGGRSFGSRPSYNKSYSGSAPSKSFSQQKNGASSAAPGSKRGMFGGMLGGMLMGGLLGSLLFGGGGFMGPNFLDILLLGGLAFLAFKFFKSRKSSVQGANSQYSSTYSSPPTSGAGTGSSGAAGGWAGLASEPIEVQSGPKVPAGFDQKEFLEGAKAAFNRLQRSWDKRDLSDIQSFTSPEVYSDIVEQSKSDPKLSETQILMLNAELLEVKEIGNQTVASVHFDAVLREDPSQVDTEQVKEIWHFSRYDNDKSSSWVLEGIQQLSN